MLRLIKGLDRKLCPNCFEYFRLREMRFRCINHKCKKEPDHVRATTWGENMPLGQVIPSPRRFAKKVPCRSCSRASTTPICPVCHLELPYAFGAKKNYIFAIIGAKETGKSNYIAVLVKKIQDIGLQLHFLLNEADDYSMARYENDFRAPLFDRNRVVDATRSAVAGGEVKRPLLFNFVGRKASSILAFFDSAGEDFGSGETMENVHRYICRSDGIILLVDPLQLREVRRQFGQSELPAMGIEPRQVLMRTTRLIQKGKSLDMSKKIPIPLAVAFSKFDMLERHVPPGLQVNSATNHYGGFDVADFEGVNDELMELLGRRELWGEGDLVNQVTSGYAKYGFFALSALGCNPVGNRVPSFSPWRVEDPFLWLLAQNRLIPTARSQ